MRGPTQFSNWVIKGKVIQGAYPRGKSEPELRKTVSSVLRAGVTCFVNLVTVHETMHLQRYDDIITAQQKMSTNQAKLPIQHIHFPIIDGGISKDNQVLNLLQTLVKLLKQGHVLYIHCFAGHGRAGTICACLLGLLYELPYKEILDRIQIYLDSREATGNFESPACDHQKRQVGRIVAKVLDGLDIM